MPMFKPSRGAPASGKPPPLKKSQTTAALASQPVSELIKNASKNVVKWYHPYMVWKAFRLDLFHHIFRVASVPGSDLDVAAVIYSLAEALGLVQALLLTVAAAQFTDSHISSTVIQPNSTMDHYETSWSCDSRTQCYATVYYTASCVSVLMYFAGVLLAVLQMIAISGISHKPEWVFGMLNELGGSIWVFLPIIYFAVGSLGLLISMLLSYHHNVSVFNVNADGSHYLPMAWCVGICLFLLFFAIPAGLKLVRAVEVIERATFSQLVAKVPAPRQEAAAPSARSSSDPSRVLARGLASIERVLHQYVEETQHNLLALKRSELLRRCKKELGLPHDATDDDSSALSRVVGTVFEKYIDAAFEEATTVQQVGDLFGSGAAADADGSKTQSI